MIDSPWQRAVASCERITGVKPARLWHRVGAHSGAVTFGLGTNPGQNGKLVAQVFPMATGNDNHQSTGNDRWLTDRYAILEQLANAHHPDDTCRFVKPVACLPDLGCIITEHVSADEFWPVIRRACSQLPRGDFAALLQHVANIATWMVRLDENTREMGPSDSAIKQSAELTLQKLEKTKDRGVLSPNEFNSARDAVSGLAEAVASERPYTVLAHGDLCPANVLINSDHSYIVDIHSAHRGLPFEDAAYFLAALDDLLIEPLRYAPQKVKALKDSFLSTYQVSIQVPQKLIDFQTLTAKVQVLNYYSRLAQTVSGVRGSINRWRTRRYVSQMKRIADRILHNPGSSEYRS